MDKKIIFFDVDGTLVDVRPSQEYIPDSTIKAIQKAKQHGHLCFLCTGRSKPEIFSHILNVGFDGIIGAGGGFVEINETLLFHKKIMKHAVKHAVDFFETHHFDFYLESNGGLYASDHLIPKLESLIYGDLANDVVARKKKSESPNHFIQSLQTGQSLYRDDVNKICFLEKSPWSFRDIENEFRDEFHVIPCTVPVFGKESGELSVLGSTKSDAIAAVIQHLGIPRENTYAYGDGLNDMDMLTFCHYGIAVGNAKEELKAIADDITDDIAEDGIYNSMKKYGLI